MPIIHHKKLKIMARHVAMWCFSHHCLFFIDFFFLSFSIIKRLSSPPSSPSMFCSRLRLPVCQRAGRAEVGTAGFHTPPPPSLPLWHWSSCYPETFPTTTASQRTTPATSWKAPQHKMATGQTKGLKHNLFVDLHIDKRGQGRGQENNHSVTVFFLIFFCFVIGIGFFLSCLWWGGSSRARQANTEHIHMAC